MNKGIAPHQRLRSDSQDADGKSLLSSLGWKETRFRPALSWTTRITASAAQDVTSRPRRGHSVHHLGDRCRPNRRQPITLILPVIMCDDPAETRSCGKYVRRRHRHGQMHQCAPARAHHLPQKSPFLPPSSFPDSVLFFFS